MITPEQKAKIKWNCRRGMLELDLILNRFLNDGFALLSDEQVINFETLLTYSDPQLYFWLMGQEEPDDEVIAEIVNTVRALHRF
ncbi:YgfY (plasmid) [Legionella adelaidensis]|uniref:FAD assembly factor SdhE n=1 Tax=Legionella adelaidensis TaxID=45056 RepID=A0A0W0R242_9GAMM|nr:succinate dehydrogenase assembly factor 2 [Legionella adelaidensis]KTC65098.1 Antitoxin CptB [Legionella adelaidensis]VEH85382.1 YgfY [Legionella adelaidensis]